MSDETHIAWTHYTASPWYVCTPVSEACKNCYAMVLSQGRMRGITGGGWGRSVPRVRSLTFWDNVRTWNKQAGKAGERRRIFPSLCDPFDAEVRVQLLWDFFWAICEAPNLDFLLLTKRPELWRERVTNAVATACGQSPCLDMLTAWLDGTPPPNVWLGTTVENQKYADIRIPQLLTIPARVRFLSCEPLLGPVNLTKINTGANSELDALRGIPTTYQSKGQNGGCSIGVRSTISNSNPRIHWVIAGGESGPADSRPMHPDWARSLRDQCAAAGVPFFFKQWGKWLPIAESRATTPEGLHQDRFFFRTSATRKQMCDNTGNPYLRESISKTHPQFDQLDGVVIQQFPQP